ncbi:MAG: Fic family protein [Candidatus Brocadiia bacterium]
MSKVSDAWKPVYSITAKAARLLMEIETARAAVEHTPLPLTLEAELRRQARVRSTHFSTRIEGNRLTLAEAEKVIRENKTEFHGRERDVREVRDYWNALLRVEEWAEASRPLSEDLIRRLHALVEHGPRSKPTPYRDGQNVIRDSSTGAIVYLPPEAADVPGLMSAFVRWIAEAEEAGVPTPLIAGLAHYQFVTIHPYYDGNGRTARLLATFLLHRGGYGLHGFLSVEEHHARDLDGYYRALAVHPHHNYYEGRAGADLTAWVEYFIATLGGTFEAVRQEAKRLSAQAGQGCALE